VEKQNKELISLERTCGSCRWLKCYIPGPEERIAYEILSDKGRLPILICGNPYSPKYRKYISRSNFCDRYFPKES